MPCTAGIKVTVAHVGVPASDAHTVMGWNAMTATHKQLHPEAQQAHQQGLGFGIQVTQVTLISTT